MNKEIYKDDLGLYLVEYDSKGNPKKVYCDENGEKEIFQDAVGPYYVEYDEKGLPAKAYCDENGNRLDTRVDGSPEVGSVEPKNESEQETIGTTEANKEEKLDYSNVGQSNPGNAATSAVGQTSSFESNENNNSKKMMWIVPILLFLLSAGAYYAYSNFLAKTKVDMSLYTVKFEPKGTEGQGTAVARIENIPNATDNISDKEKVNEIDKFLASPTIKYSKDKSLKNGDEVEVSLELDKAKAEEYGLELDGEFKKTFEVSGLTTGSAASNSSNSKTESANNEPNKNWFVVNGQHRADDGNHPDTQLRNGFNSWAAGEGMSLERMKGGAEFKGEILGNKIMVDGKAIDLRFIRYRGETEETVKGGEILKDTYNVVGVFSDKSSVIYITAIYNGKAQVFKAELDGGKPEVKDGLIVFEEENNSSLKSMFQGVIDRMK